MLTWWATDCDWRSDGQTLSLPRRLILIKTSMWWQRRFADCSDRDVQQKCSLHQVTDDSVEPIRGGIPIVVFSCSPRSVKHTLGRRSFPHAFISRLGLHIDAHMIRDPSIVVVNLQGVDFVLRALIISS